MADSKSNLIEFMQAFDRLIPMDSSANSSGVSPPNQIPTWAVKILEYTESAIHGFENYCALRGFYARTSRGTNMAAKTDILSSNTLRHSHVILYIPRGNLQTKLESHIFKSMPISKITIVNIAEMNGVIGKLQEIEYEQCYVQQLEPMLDWLLVELKITKYSNTLYKYGTDGRLEGKDMAIMDYTLNPKIDVHIYSNRPSEDDEDHSEQDEHEADSHDDDLTKPEDKSSQEEKQSQVDSVGDQVQEAENGASSQDDSKKEDTQADSQADVLNTLDNIQQNGLEGVLPPESQNALSAVKALASGDQEALTQSALSLAGVDPKRVDQVNKVEKFLADAENFGKKKSGSSNSGNGASGSDLSSDAAADGGDSGGATSDDASGGSASDSASGGSASDGAAGGSASDSAAGGSASDSAAGGSASDGAAGGSSSDGAAGGSASDGASAGSSSDGAAGGSASDGAAGGSASDGAAGGSASDGAAGGSASYGVAGGSASDGASGGSTSDGAAGGSSSDGAAGGSTSDGAAGGSSSDSASGGGNPASDNAAEDTSTDSSKSGKSKKKKKSLLDDIVKKLDESQKGR